MRSRAFSAPAALAAFTLTLAVGCGAGGEPRPKSQPSPEAPESTELTAGFIAEPRSLDFTSDDGAAIPQALLVNVYEGLVKVDSDGRIQPALAEEWQVNPDHTVYTFTLREGVEFSDGAPFTAEDAVFSIERVQSEWTPQVKTGMDVVKSAEAVDDATLKVTLKRPSNSWLFSMTTRIGAMFSRTGVEDLATAPVGTGPYTVSDWRRGDAIELTANPTYWGEAPPLDHVVLRYFESPTAANNAMLAGDLDVIATQQAPETLERFEGDDRFQVIEGSTNSEVVLSFNHESEPLTDVRVRRAIKYALNRPELLETAWAGKGELIGSMVPPTDPWYEDLSQEYPYDPDRARGLLDDAGYGDGLTLRLRIPGNLPYAVNSAQVVQSQLAEVGITAKIEELEFPARWLEEVFNAADYDMSIIAHVEPRDLVSWGNPDYYWRYDNPDVQRLLAEGDAGTRDEHVTKLREAARLLSQDAAADWLFLLPNLIVARDGVRGLPVNVVSESFDVTAISVDPG